VMTALSPFEGLNLDRLIERRQLDDRSLTLLAVCTTARGRVPFARYVEQLVLSELMPWIVAHLYCGKDWSDPGSVVARGS